MSSTSWLQNLRSALAPSRGQGNHRRRGALRAAMHRPKLEVLEDRCVPSTFAAFDLGNPESGPFPSDRFTVADASQLTGRRVNLTPPDQSTRPSDHDDISVIDTLDGFNLQPRLSVAFSGPIDVNTVNSNTVFLIKLADPTAPEEGGGQVVGINQTVWDVATNTLHVESDELLDQHTRYALIVTRGVHDAAGQPVEASDEFSHFRHDLNFGQSQDADWKVYRKEMLDALQVARGDGVAEKDIVTASVFTTQSATAVLEKIRDQIHAATPQPADFNLGTKGEPTVFSRNAVTGITFHKQTGTKGVASDFTNVQLTANLAALPMHGAVGELAFGKYLSPDYEVHPDAAGRAAGEAGEYIPPVGTRTGTPEVQGYNEIDFNLFLPAGQMPEGGWPVAIYGHGNTDIKNDSFLVAATLAEHTLAEQGIATIAINAVGHGFGPLGTLIVNSSARGPATFSAGGRGRDQDGHGTIDANEGISATSPRGVLFYSDGIRQTAADLMQLVRVIQVGMVVPGYGGGQQALNPSRISYFGHSLGANYGTVFLAVEPDVSAGVLNAPGNPPANREWGGRAALGMLLQSRTPSLVNSPGISVFGGLTVGTPYFDENMPLRDGTPLPVTLTLADGVTTRADTIKSPVNNTVPGAMAIQEVLTNIDWASQAGSPVAYAPHLRKAPLPGVSAKSVIYQFNLGDTSAPNPNTTAILRAGDLADRATFYRHDLAFAADPTLPKNPHRFLLGQPAATTPSARLRVAEIARGYQEQIKTFFASDGEPTGIIHPQPAGLFETPIAGALPESLNFITGPLPGTLLTINDVTVTASDTGIVTAVFTLSLSAPSSQPVTVNYATADGTATAAGNDYVPISGTLTFAPGETTRTITVVVNPDRKKDADETFFVDLSGAVNALLLDDQGLGIILSDDWK
jgi:hypothetical protein